MTNVIATDAPVYFAASDNDDVVVAGVLEPSGAVATSLTLVATDNELEFVAQAAGLSDSYNPLPDSGTLTAGEIYGYGGGLVIVRQTHERTQHAPEDVPALFCVYRPDAADTLAWIANEPVYVGTRRTHGGELYVCIQAHTTQDGWTPNATPALWSVVEDEPAEPDAWQAPIGSHDAYSIGDRVTHAGQIWQSLVNGNVWEPGTPGTEALWQAVMG